MTGFHEEWKAPGVFTVCATKCWAVGDPACWEIGCRYPCGDCLAVAKAIEAGTAKTEGLGPQDESAVPKGFAQ